MSDRVSERVNPWVSLPCTKWTRPQRKGFQPFIEMVIGLALPKVFLCPSPTGWLRFSCNDPPADLLPSSLRNANFDGACQARVYVAQRISNGLFFMFPTTRFPFRGSWRTPGWSWGPKQLEDPFACLCFQNDPSTWQLLIFAWEDLRERIPKSKLKFKKLPNSKKAFGSEFRSSSVIGLRSKERKKRDAGHKYSQVVTVHTRVQVEKGFISERKHRRSFIVVPLKDDVIELEGTVVVHSRNVFKVWRRLGERSFGKFPHCLWQRDKPQKDFHSSCDKIRTLILIFKRCLCLGVAKQWCRGKTWAVCSCQVQPGWSI